MQGNKRSRLQTPPKERKTPPTAPTTPASAQKTQRTNDFTVLGEGQYNCALLHRNGTVVRVTATYAKYQDLFERSAHLLKLFNQHAQTLGPSVLRQVEDSEVIANIADMPLDLLTSLKGCTQVAKMLGMPGVRYYVQHIEYAPSGDLYTNYVVDPVDLQAMAFQAFSLMWFLYVAQAKWGFRHRDFKMENVLLRVTPQQERYTFTLDGKAHFSFQSRFVPVVIDLDFGSLYTTNIKQRNIVGTAYTAPPEVAFERLTDTWRDEKKLQDNASYDWYSLGMTLLLFWVTRDVPGERSSFIHGLYRTEPILMRRFYDTLNNVPGVTIEEMQRKDYVNTLIMVPFYLKALTGEDMIRVPNYLTSVLTQYSALEATPHVQTTMGMIDARLAVPQKQLLARLLSMDWEHTRLYPEGNVWTYFLEMSLFDPFRVGLNFPLPPTLDEHQYAFGPQPIFDYTINEATREQINKMKRMQGIGMWLEW